MVALVCFVETLLCSAQSKLLERVAVITGSLRAYNGSTHARLLYLYTFGRSGVYSDVLCHAVFYG